METKTANLYTVKINPDHITTETVIVSNSTLNGATSGLGVYACTTYSRFSSHWYIFYQKM